MCMCGKPTRNGEPGYSWDGKTIGVRQPDPPELADGDILMYDEPGRCGGVDSHCHHFRVVRDRYDNIVLLVRNGSGDERINHFTNRVKIETALVQLDSDGRYWLLCSLYHIKEDAASTARSNTNLKWRKAAAEKRIKTRKLRGGGVKVWIEEAP